MSTLLITAEMEMIPNALNWGQWQTLGIASGTRGKQSKGSERIGVEVWNAAGDACKV